MRAEKRLLAAADKLMAALLEIAMDKSEPSMVRLAAIRDALNRAGLDVKSITPEKTSDPWAALLGDATSFEDDRSLGGSDPVAELEQAAMQRARLPSMPTLRPGVSTKPRMQQPMDGAG